MSGVPLAALKIFLIIIGFKKVESNRKKISMEPKFGSLKRSTELTILKLDQPKEERRLKLLQTGIKEGTFTKLTEIKRIMREN